MITVIIPRGTRLIIADTEQVIETTDALRITLDLTRPLIEVRHFRVGDDNADSDCEACAGSGNVLLADGYGFTDCPCTFPPSQALT